MLLLGTDAEGQGSTPALFVGTAAFEVIVKQQIKRLEEPGLKCCQLVYDELIRILGQLLAKIVRSRIGRYAHPVF
jgi:replication fork clamp-binding protein CrfC